MGMHCWRGRMRSAVSSNPSSDTRSIFLLETGQAPLLTDRIRMEAFTRAIEFAVRPGMRVLDAGCGTGILSLLAARAGAVHVTAIERDPSLAALARDIVQANGMGKVITILCGDAATPPANELYDLIISETAGHLLFDEDLLCLRQALQSRLAEGGLFLPAAVRLYGVPVCSKVWQEQSAQLQKVAGFDFDVLLQQYGHTPLTLPLDPSELLTPAVSLMTFDLMGRVEFPTMAETDFELSGKSPCNGIGLFFEMDLVDGVRITTDPGQAPTHWRQGFLPLLKPISGEKLHFRLHAATPGLAGLSWSMEHSHGSQYGAAALSLLEPVS